MFKVNQATKVVVGNKGKWLLFDKAMDVIFNKVLIPVTKLSLLIILVSTSNTLGIFL